MFEVSERATAIRPYWMRPEVEAGVVEDETHDRGVCQCNVFSWRHHARQQVALHSERAVAQFFTADGSVKVVHLLLPVVVVAGVLHPLLLRTEKFDTLGLFARYNFRRVAIRI